MISIFRQFLFALSFLTVAPFPCPCKENDTLARSAAFFPLVGAALGIVLYAADALLRLLFPPAVSSAAVLIILAALTAGLHLDGLADTADGLGAAIKHGRKKALEVMKDSRSGSLGVCGLVLVLLLKYALLLSLPVEERLTGLVLMPAAGRWILVLAGGIFPYAGLSPGLGSSFAGRITLSTSLIATFWIALTAGIAAAGSAGVPGALLAALAGGLLTAWSLSRCFGGMTGDTLGAVNEAAEVFFLMGLEALM